MGPKAYEGYLSDLTRNERKTFYKDNPEIELNMTNFYFSLITSLISLEYYVVSDSSSYTTYLGSSLLGVLSKLNKVNDSHYKLLIDYTQCKAMPADIQIKVDLLFDEKGFKVEILNGNITGNDAHKIRNILVCPFLGSTGGTKGVYDEDAGGYMSEEKPWENGYVVMPDGSGALIDMVPNNIANLSGYSSYVYGKDPSQDRSYSSYASENAGIKEIKMPVYGIAKTNSNAAFVGYATSGEEYMQLIMSPDNTNRMHYSWASSLFNYNFEYTQIYNQAGSSYTKLSDKRNQFDLGMKFDFLANDDADYVGMAKDYRNHLLANGELEIKEQTYDKIPMRLDFLMSEVESSLVGDKEIITTNIKQLDEMLEDIKDNLHVENSVISLFGWQKGGQANQHPAKAKFFSKVGTKSQFRKLIEKYRKQNYDISFRENYYLINTKQMPYLNNASKHVNGYYDKYFNWLQYYSKEYGIAKADKAYEFILSQYNKLKKGVKANNITFEGIAEHLASDEYRLSRTEARNYIMAAFKHLSEDGAAINAINPNKYLWKYVDRFFDIDAHDSVLLIETQNIPFIQLVLNGTMEMYSTYCNFSFYDDYSICNMIDFNIYPSFMLTYDSAYYLLKTNSNAYFSTQYDVYRNLVNKVYEKVSSALNEVINATWESRSFKDNVAINKYSNGKTIIINYNKNDVVVDGNTIPGEGFKVI